MAKESTQAPLIAMPAKMRIRLFESTGILISDRLVEQETEFRLGPKEPHTGPMSLEVTANSQETVDKLIEYLKKIKGDLPITSDAKKPITKKLDKMLSEKEPLLDLLKSLKKSKTQEALITALRGYEFRFIMPDVVEDLGTKKDQIILREKDKDYQFMVRLFKEAKDPANDKWDFRLAIGIKILGNKVDKVRIYLWGKYEETWQIAWEKPKANNFKRVEKLHTFPPFMDYEDRKKWRKEHKMLTESAPEDRPEPTKFYTKWTPHIKIN